MSAINWEAFEIHRLRFLQLRNQRVLRQRIDHVECALRSLDLHYRKDRARLVKLRETLEIERQAQT